jgi:tetratricopeptide (TPR) repeat protein
MVIRSYPGISALLLVFFLIGITVTAAPGDPAVLVAQGDAQVQAKNYPEALAAYEQAIALDPRNFNAWNGKADALNRAGNFTEALAASDTAIVLLPTSTKGWINRGYILYNLGRYDDELRAYETAISIEPDNAVAWFNKGYSLAGMKRYDEAIAAFDKVKSLQPDYPKLDANRKIAEQLRDAGTPVHVRYAPVIAGIIVILVIIGGLIYRNKKRADSDREGMDNRQSRRRKERKPE